MELNNTQIDILIKKCKKGDRIAFDKLMTYFQNKVYGFAYKLSLNYDEASDITIETFARVFKSISTFRHEANFTSWMYTIVKNVYLDRVYAAKKIKYQSYDSDIKTKEGDIQREFRDETQTPEETLLAEEKKEKLIEIINSLPNDQAMVIKMYHLEELGYEEISEILNVPLGTVKSRINRARKTLEVKLKEFIKE